jgi:hypothetical protein
MPLERERNLYHHKFGYQEEHFFPCFKNFINSYLLGVWRGHPKVPVVAWLAVT